MILLLIMNAIVLAALAVILVLGGQNDRTRLLGMLCGVLAAVNGSMLVLPVAQ